ncbi:MAG: carboxy-S-adenosyl-L-methionine synthase CmoA [Nitrospinota bacterium]|nr:carboxy-S-adenosyl-L-methionine synthase CmoA [Nitrospinota bacterium]
MPTKKKDTLFKKSSAPGKFEFNEPVARVFDDMLERSVPFYKECQQMVIDLARHFAQKGSAVYDLGCSTGTLLRHLVKAIPPTQKIRFVGLDNSAAMLKKARVKLKGYLKRCELMEADLEDGFKLHDASVVIMNYTLQFIPPKRRAAMLKKIYKGLRPGGGLILIEKVRGETDGLNNLFVEQYHTYKQDQGYSKLEIAKKREALENVLVPLKPGKNRDLLAAAGFSQVDIFFKWFNFAGFLAVKPGKKRG